MKENDIPDLNLFMICKELNSSAFSSLDQSFYLRSLKPQEFDIWKRMPFDLEGDHNPYDDFMTDYFQNVYQDRQEDFYKQCQVVCEKDTDKIVATAFIWQSYHGKVTTLHWFKTLKEYEGLGIGRALLSDIFKKIRDDDYPIILHTQASSYRAIGLYAAFGFKFIENQRVGYRENNLKEALPILKEFMLAEKFSTLQFDQLDSLTNDHILTNDYPEF